MLKLIDGVLVDDDGQQIAELCDGALKEQGEALAFAYNNIDAAVALAQWWEAQAQSGLSVEQCIATMNAKVEAFLANTRA